MTSVSQIASCQGVDQWFSWLPQGVRYDAATECVTLASLDGSSRNVAAWSSLNWASMKWEFGFLERQTKPFILRLCTRAVSRCYKQFKKGQGGSLSNGVPCPSSLVLHMEVLC